MPPPVPTGGLPLLGYLGGLLREAVGQGWTVPQLQASMLPHMPVVAALRDGGVLPHEFGFLRAVLEGRAVPPEQLAARLSVIADRLSDLEEASGVNEALLERFRGMTAAAVVPLPAGLRPSATGVIALRPEGAEDKLFCPVCSTENEGTHKFCDGCGQALIQEVPQIAKFCHECGQPFPERLSTIQGSNRNVTMVFTDLMGFSAFAEKLKPSVLFPLINEILEGLARAVTAEGGYISGYWGDAVFAIFGAHQEREDDPARAVRAALRMQEFLRSWNERHRGEGYPELQIRIGVNSGRVAWGPLGGPGRIIQTALGNDVNKAARLEPLAKFEEDDPTSGQKVWRGGIAISRPTRDRLGPEFAVERIGEVHVKNIEEPVEYFRLVKERPVEVDLSPRGTEQVTFIGRSDELGVLREEYRLLKVDRKARLAVVAGEAGRGKSRLAAEFFKELSEGGEDYKRLTLKGEDQEARTPYKAVGLAVRALVGIKGGESPEEARERLRSFVEAAVVEKRDLVDRHIYLLGNLIGISYPDVPPWMEYLLKDAMELRERTLDSVVALFDHLTRRRPVVIVLEDLHWIDRGSLRFVKVTLDRLKDQPLFVLGLTRPRFADQVPDLMKGEYPVRRVNLERLPPNILAAMVTEVLAGKRIEEEDLDFVIDQADGNPYLAQEMARALRDGWEIRKDRAAGQRYFVDLKGNHVPPGAQSFLQGRIDVLPEDHQKLLRCASVIGAEFTADEVERLGAGGAAAMLPELVRRNILIDVGGGRYQFPHALLRDTVLEEIPEGEVQILHRGRAWYLGEERPGELALIASHLERGAVPNNAASYYLKAARDAADNKGAYVTAADFAERAYKQATAAGSQKTQLEALLMWEEALYMDRKYEEGLRVLEEARQLVQAGSFDRSERIAFQYQYGRALTFAKKPDQAEIELKSALDLFEASENTLLRCRILMVLGTNATENRRDHRNGHIFYRQAVDVARALNDRVALVKSLTNLVVIGVHTGDHSLSLEAGSEAREVYDERFVSVRDRLKLDNNVGSVFMNVGDYEGAATIFEGAIGLSRQRGGGFQLHFLLPNLARAASLMGRDDALPLLREASDYHQGRPDEFMAGVAHLYTALHYVRVEQWDLAEREASESLRVAEIKKDKKLEAMARMALAQVSMGKGDLDRAFTENSRVFELLRKFNWEIEEFDLEIMLTHARLLVEKGDEKGAWEVINGSRKRKIKGAHLILQERAAKISDAGQRASFLTRVVVNQEIEKLWRLLRRHTTRGESADRFIARLSYRTPDSLPLELAFIDPSRIGEVALGPKGENETIAGTIIERPIEEVLKGLLTRTVRVGKNTGDYPGVWGRKILWSPFFDDEGVPHANVEFELASHDPKLLEMLDREAGIARSHKLILQGRVDEKRVREEGIVVLEMNVQEGQSLGPQHLGKITFIVVPTANGETLLALKFQDRFFTKNPNVYLKRFINRLRQ